MATFRVGQRVRIVRNIEPDSDLVVIGKEATVVADAYECVDGFWWYELHVAGLNNQIWAMPEELEPIQPERNQVVAWSECVWTPHKTEQTA